MATEFSDMLNETLQKMSERIELKMNERKFIVMVSIVVLFVSSSFSLIQVARIGRHVEHNNQFRLH